jgi:hypothetical protein
MWGRAIGILVAGCLFISSALANGPFGVARIGNWSLGAYSNDATGAFSHCAAATQYAGGLGFVVALDTGGIWTLGFTQPTWQLETGKSIPIDLTFDGQAQFHVFGAVKSPTIVIVSEPNNSALMKRFSKSSNVAAVAMGTLYQLLLSNAAQVVPALANCRSVAKRRGVTDLGDLSAKAPPKPSVVVSSLKPDQPQAGSPEFQIEAIELATNFILKSALRNPQVLPRSETPAEYVSFAAAWKSDEAFGIVRIVPPQANLKGIDVAAAVAAGDAKDCKGKFASGRMSELVDSDVVFRGFASCDDTDGPRTAQYFIVPRKKGGFILFSVVSSMKTEQSRAVVKDEKLVDFRKAALTAASFQP